MTKEQETAFKKQIEEDMSIMYEVERNKMGDRAWKKFVDAKIAKQLPAFLKSINNVNLAEQSYQSEEED
tara:strand:- start:6502 stop:6708 length:207 start_codon:yes stop_codon:yes gene_type:complete